MVVGKKRKEKTVVFTQGIDFLLTEQPEEGVSQAEQPEAAVPVQSDAVTAPTPPPDAAHTWNSEGEEDN